MIKNYTSTVPAVKSINWIEAKLVARGAKNILKLYDDKRLDGIAFIIDVNGKQLAFRLPARIKRIEELFKASVRRPREGTFKNIQDQAERTAWKLLADWVEVQMSLIELQQVEFVEVFLPYVYDPAKQETFFERLKGSGFKMLTDGKG